MRFHEIRTRGSINYSHLRFGLSPHLPPLARVITFGFWLARRRMLAGAKALAHFEMKVRR